MFPAGHHSPVEAARIAAAGGTVVAGRVLGMLQVSRSLGDARFKGCGVTAEPDLVRYVLRSGGGRSTGEEGNSDTASEAEDEVPYSMPLDLDLDLAGSDSDGGDDSTAAAPAGQQLRRCETTEAGTAAAVLPLRAGAAGECRTVAAGAAGRDEFVVIASDGLWAVMSNADVVRFVHAHTRGLLLAPEPLDVLQSCANDLVQEALVRGSRDNITATILYFAPAPTAPSSPAAVTASAAATATATPTPGALAVLASPPRTGAGTLRRCSSATFASDSGGGSAAVHR